MLRAPTESSKRSARSIPGVAPRASVNLQGDLPTIAGRRYRCGVAPARRRRRRHRDAGGRRSRSRQNAPTQCGQGGGHAGCAGPAARLYFTRATAPAGEGPLYHHVGLLRYRRAALERFVKLPPSPLERREKLEQLRALEAGIAHRRRDRRHRALGVDTGRIWKERAPC